MGKDTAPVTLDDLQATAKDDRKGLCFHGYLKVYWDDATSNFSYWYKGNPITAMMVEGVLKGMYGR